MICRIDKGGLEQWLAEDPEFIGALRGLAKIRVNARAALTEAKPVVAYG